MWLWLQKRGCKSGKRCSCGWSRDSIFYMHAGMQLRIFSVEKVLFPTCPKALYSFTPVSLSLWMVVPSSHRPLILVQVSSSCLCREGMQFLPVIRAPCLTQEVHSLFIVLPQLFSYPRATFFPRHPMSHPPEPLCCMPFKMLVLPASQSLRASPELFAPCCSLLPLSSSLQPSVCSLRDRGLFVLSWSLRFFSAKVSTYFLFPPYCT